MLPFKSEMELLKTIPGIDTRSAENIIAEIGVNMKQFPSANHLASWVGVCPGNNESAGKRKSGKTPKGSKWLRRALAEIAWVVSHTKNTYLSAQYHRLASRRGKKKAVWALAHTILTICYHILKNKVPYKDLGHNYFEQLHPEQLKRYLVKKLEKLGHKVILEPLPVAA